jgi:ABC-2 type transport system permease protein
VTDSPLLQLTLARLRMSFREPSTLFWSFAFPILLTVALGIAFRDRPPEPITAAVQQGPGAQELAHALAKSGQAQASVLPAEEARRALRGAKVSLIVVPGATRTYEYDPTRPESRLARAVVDDVLQRFEGRQDVTSVEDAHVTEAGSRYIDFLVPGLIGSNIMSAGMWGIGYVIVETRTRKLLKRLIATPMRRRDFLLSFVLMRMLFALLELPVLLVFSILAFSITIRGSIVLLAGLAVLGALAFAGIAVLLAARATNTETVTGLINLVVMPMYILSGVFFSYSRFPEAAQPLIRLLPLTALLDSMRAVMNEGAGLATVAPQAALLAATAGFSFFVALRIFRWS